VRPARGAAQKVREELSATGAVGKEAGWVTEAVAMEGGLLAKEAAAMAREGVVMEMVVAAMGRVAEDLG